MPMFANGSMGRTFLREVSNKKNFGIHSTEPNAQDITKHPEEKNKKQHMVMFLPDTKDWLSGRLLW